MLQGHIQTKMTYIFYLLQMALSTLLFPNNGEIVITIHNIQAETGTIRIGLYDIPDNFPKKGKAFRIAIINAQRPSVEHRFKNIPKGNYAIAIHHDANGDDQMNTNFIGFPKEPYGFSQNFAPRFRPPSFKDTQFEVTGPIKLSINLIQ